MAQGSIARVLRRRKRAQTESPFQLAAIRQEQDSSETDTPRFSEALSFEVTEGPETAEQLVNMLATRMRGHDDGSGNRRQWIREQVFSRLIAMEHRAVPSLIEGVSAEWGTNYGCDEVLRRMTGHWPLRVDAPKWNFKKVQIAWRQWWKANQARTREQWLAGSFRGVVFALREEESGERYEHLWHLVRYSGQSLPESAFSPELVRAIYDIGQGHEAVVPLASRIPTEAIAIGVLYDRDGAGCQAEAACEALFKRDPRTATTLLVDALDTEIPGRRTILLRWLRGQTGRIDLRTKQEWVRWMESRRTQQPGRGDAEDRAPHP